MNEKEAREILKNLEKNAFEPNMADVAEAYLEGLADGREEGREKADKFIEKILNAAYEDDHHIMNEIAEQWEKEK